MISQPILIDKKETLWMLGERKEAGGDRTA